MHLDSLRVSEHVWSLELTYQASIKNICMPLSKKGSLFREVLLRDTERFCGVFWHLIVFVAGWAVSRGGKQLMPCRRPAVQGTQRQSMEVIRRRRSRAQSCQDALLQFMTSWKVPRHTSQGEWRCACIAPALRLHL